VADLKDKSDVIVEVNVGKTASKSLEYKHVVFTITNVEVQKTFKGDQHANDSINILELGGFYDNKEYVYGNNHVLQPGEKVILFLERYQGLVTNDAYVIKGVFQGKFKLDGSKGKLEKNNEKFGELQNVQSIEDLKLSN